MHLLALCGCLALVAAAPLSSPVAGAKGAEAAFTLRQEMPPTASPVAGAQGAEAVFTPWQEMPPTASPVAGAQGAEAAFTSRQEMPPTQYQDELEYEDMLTRVPVLLLTPGELEGLLNEVQYQYDESNLGEKTIQDGYDYELLDDDSQEQGEEEDQDSQEDVVSRSKRQVSQEALNLALSHTDHNGNNRPVGRIHGRVDVNGFRNNRNDHHTQAGLGLGSVVYRSNNGRHSLGVGAYGTQGRGRFNGYRYRTRPQWGAGIGYRFRF